MSKPNTILIHPDEGWFQYIGKALASSDQFIAYVTGAMPDNVRYHPGVDWQRLKRWIAVLHRFDSDGNHINTSTRLGGYAIEGNAIAGERALEQLWPLMGEVAGNGKLKLGDVRVKPFEVVIDGITHGLVYFQSEEDPESEWVMLEPCDIMFHPPWDSGKYST